MNTEREALIELLLEMSDFCKQICNSSPDSPIKGDIESKAFYIGHHPFLLNPDSALLAIKAGDGQAPKEGWKLVPIEPTHEMVMNARKADYGDLGQVGQKTIRVCYKAMIAAAPTDKEGK